MPSIARNSPASMASSFRPDIEGLRALAIVAVIVNHFNNELAPSGYLGVDIFFVISGFVITSSMARTSSTTLGEFLILFYTRRIKRLVPALVLCVVVTIILICLFNPHPEQSLRTGIASLFGLSNLYLLKLSTTYFAASPETNAFIHTWSLGVEEQFYFIFPFVFWVSGFGRLNRRSRKIFFALTGAITIASLVAFIYVYPRIQPAAYFLMPARLWELGAGCLLFFYLGGTNKLFDVLGRFPTLLVFSAVIAVLFLPLDFAVPATISVVVLTAVLIAALRPETIAYEILCHPVVSYNGSISYSLYLWHWSILSISRWSVGIHMWTAPFQVALMLLIAAASFRYVEMPLRRAEWSPLPWRSIAYGLATSLSAAVVVFIVGKPLKGRLEQIGDYIYPPAYASPGIFQYDLYCHLPKRSETAFDDCLKAASSGSRNIYLIGDSHASNHYPGISEAIQTISGLSVRVLIDWGFINSLSGKESCGILIPCIQDSFRKHLSFFVKI